MRHCPYCIEGQIIYSGVVVGHVEPTCPGFQAELLKLRKSIVEKAFLAISSDWGKIEYDAADIFAFLTDWDGEL